MLCGDELERRFARLGVLIEALQSIWRPQPFKLRRPPWCADHPELTAALLALDEARLAQLTADNAALLAWLAPWLAHAAELAALIALPEGAKTPLPDAGRHFAWGIPGRKQAQVEAFCAALGAPVAPVVDWCAGKGHLGRRIAAAWGSAVDSLDHDSVLLRDGAALAARARQPRQAFVAADLQAPAAVDKLAGRHVVALHACGDLHRDLIRAAPESGLVALDLSPCCYARTRDARLRYFTAEASVQLDRDDLRLVVTDSLTTSARETALRRQENAWKLGFLSLLGPAYRPLAALPVSWLRGDFASFCRLLGEREAIDLASGADFPAAEAAGWRRLAEVERLSLPRLSLRRPIEVWLALDAACYLQRRGFATTLAEFCKPAQTPRNLILSARRRAVAVLN